MSIKDKWADPVWAAAQRKKISAGVKRSPHRHANADAAKRQRPLSRYSIADTAAESGKRGADKRWLLDERGETRPVYHPLHDNPRMQRLLGGSR